MSSTLNGSVLPIEVSLKAKVLKNGRMRFRYVEGFAPGEEELVKRTFETFKGPMALVGISVALVDKRTVAVTGTVDRTTLGNMMTTEFLCWGSLGEYKLRDLLISSCANGMNAGRHALAKELQHDADGLVRELKQAANDEDPCDGGICH